MASILKNTAIVGTMTALSRVLGLVREMLQSRLIGAGWEQSAFTLAFAIPNMARKLFGEGALTSAFVPVFKEELEARRIEEARQLARAVMTMSFFMLGAVVVLSVLGVTVALGYRPWGLDGASPECSRVALILQLTRLLLPYMIFICGAAFGMGVLNAMEKFTASALMPCLLNVFWIASLVYLSFCGDLALAARVQRVAAAILIAGAAQMGFMFWCMHRRGMTPGLTFTGWLAPKTKLVWRNTVIGAVGAGAVQINYMLDQVLGQAASPWAAGVIGYAERLMDLPLGVVGVAFGTVLLPVFSGRFAKNDAAGARQALLAAVDKMLFVMMPAAVGLGILAPDVTRLIYEGRAFDAVATTRVARAVACYAAGLGFFGLQKCLVPWFQAQKDMSTPLRVSVKMVFLNAALNILAVVFLPVEWKHVGLAASTVVCAGASCLLLGRLAVRRNGDVGFRGLVGPVGKTCLAAGLMGIALEVARQGLVRVAAQRGWMGPGVQSALLIVLVGVGGIVYFAAVFALNPATFRARLRSLRRRGRR
ncbi:MAG: murein biosynthesis integral membrane protein MurJ [Kiritimatiellia bacterium]